MATKITRTAKINGHDVVRVNAVADLEIYKPINSTQYGELLHIVRRDDVLCSILLDGESSCCDSSSVSIDFINYEEK